MYCDYSCPTCNLFHLLSLSSSNPCFVQYISPANDKPWKMFVWVLFEPCVAPLSLHKLNSNLYLPFCLCWHWTSIKPPARVSPSLSNLSLAHGLEQAGDIKKKIIILSSVTGTREIWLSGIERGEGGGGRNRGCNDEEYTIVIWTKKLPHLIYLAIEVQWFCMLWQSKKVDRK